ncbi:NADPH-dependent 1-acyldihydroxyacetone phosphate reductase [Achaetomium macrosporum]|uniref:NADPH-dependent 1-acyldihydroxyacetone phosphate reductase n=1 Tax=Achaetomium macrosporum TaxID=79813 RepID=A0AAN7CH31_9PEZI|nr:NADPH-dependent 1-acyldihydroxyacetone phosphate reductase [Achaetomium macrosporum]
MSLPGKLTILITGCSAGGMGAALASTFHSAGHHVYATARNPSKLAPLAKQGIQTLTLDVTSPSSIAAAVASVTASLPAGQKGLDMLINNAASHYMMPTVDASLDAARALFDLNVFAQLAVTQAFLPLLLRSSSSLSQNNSFQPMIVNHTSVGSVATLPFHGIYNASKAALAMLSSTMRMELAPFGVRVVDLKSAGVRTNIIGNSNVHDPARADRLPEGSIYAPAREAVERAMAQEGFRGKGMAPEQWAREVAGLLLGGRGDPPRVIWKGEGAMLARVAAAVPWCDGLFEGTVKRITGLDAVERVLEERRAEQMGDASRDG